MIGPLLLPPPTRLPGVCLPLERQLPGEELVQDHPKGVDVLGGRSGGGVWVKVISLPQQPPQSEVGARGALEQPPLLHSCTVFPGFMRSAMQQRLTDAKLGFSPASTSGASQRGLVTPSALLAAPGAALSQTLERLKSDTWAGEQGRAVPAGSGAAGSTILGL